tara:strand:+ start:732 stop:3197 length:2466 start_codon:yes stop_codon:yes gene_type:complete
MKKGVIILLILIFSVSLVSANWFTDLFNFGEDSDLEGELTSLIGEENLIAHYQFEDNVQDSVGGNHGTNNGASFVDGIDGKAASFDGVEDYINIENLEGLSTSKLTISFWERQSAVQSNYMVPLGLFGGHRALIYVVPGDYRHVVKFDNINNVKHEPSLTTSDSEWHHYLITFDGISLKAYYDGRLLVDKEAVGEILKKDNSIFIGTSGTGTSPSQWNYFNGLIDEVKIWNRILSEREIKIEAGIEVEPIEGIISIDFNDVTGEVNKKITSGFTTLHHSTISNSVSRIRELNPSSIRMPDLFSNDEQIDIITKDGGELIFNFDNYDPIISSLKEEINTDPFIDFTLMNFELTSCYGTPGCLNVPWWRAPPKNYLEWEEAVYETVYHYNIKEDKGITYWEVWGEPINELKAWPVFDPLNPNPNEHEMGWTFDKHIELYNITRTAIKKADPNAKVGGLAFAHPNWVSEDEKFLLAETFIDRLAEKDIGLDFLSFHTYDRDINYTPENYANVISRLRNKLDEKGFSDTELIMNEWGIALDPIYYDQCNSNEQCFEQAITDSSNKDAAYVASSVPVLLDSKLDSANFYALTKWPSKIIYEDGSITPIFNVFKMLTILGDKKVNFNSDLPKISVLPTKSGGYKTAVLLSYYDKENVGLTKKINLELNNLDFEKEFVVKEYLIDKTHSNKFYDLNHQELDKIKEYSVDKTQDYNLDIEMEPNSVRLVILELKYICNNNNICDSELGETTENCPNDCDTGILEPECESTGLRQSGKYCSFDKTWIVQKVEEETCNNNFECETNVCVDDECISAGLFRRFLEWLRALFG